jgi:type VI secretion system protein ImpI
MSNPPLVVLVEDVDRRTASRSAFIKSPVRVGRGELNDLVIDAPFVSTWHGVIQFDAGGFRFVDLGSTNGTSLDGAPLERNVPSVIVPGADLRIGPIRIGLSWGASEQLPERERPKTQFAMRAADFPVPAPLPAPARPEAGREPGRPEPGREPESVPREVEEAALRAVEDASWQLGVLKESLQQARDNFDGAVTLAVAPLAEPARRRARTLIAERFAGAAGGGAAVPAPVTAGAADATLQVVKAFADSYVAAGVPLDGRADVEAFLGVLAELLETSVKSYLELRRGYDEFGREMGVRVPQGEGAVGRLRDARQLLGYLLQPTTTEPRSRELASAFADLMIHQVALLNGVTAGATDLLERLSPEAVTATLDEEGGGGRLSLGVKAIREGAQWRAYVARHASIAGEENAVADALFGKAFARAYAAVAGKRDGGPDGPDSTPRPR